MNTHRFPHTKADGAWAPHGVQHAAHHAGDPPHPGDGVLEELPLVEQEVMILSHFYGLARNEIASIIGASVSVVDQLISSAVEHLRQQLTRQQAA